LHLPNQARFEPAKTWISQETLNSQFSQLHVFALANYGLKVSLEELLFLTKTFDLVSNGTLEIETEDGYDATNAMNMFAEEVCEDKLLFWLFFPFPWFSLLIL